MDVSELRAMSDADLRDQYAESKRELFNLRMQLAARQLENFRRIREVRRDVARVLTVLGERNRGGGTQS
ncbi:MAG: 50S ribosomal protein L29 [Chloroflexota bacterium]|nr:50S ribosomal protein L29 [Chloroflexota bacterium]